MTKLGSIYESEILIERIENLAAELELAARWQRPYVLLAVYGSELVRSQVEQALRAQLNGLGQETAYVKVKNRKASDIVNCLKQFTNPENTVFFFDGLQWSQAEPTDAYSALNLQREFFIERKVRVIFWLTQSEITALAHGAPDFWTCRNRVIEFVDAPHEE
ncbi:MAG TPA: hypothetical protein VHM28_03910, partial [Anaerolineales bacterium]|nr:hypothetical protein [Anaerolineales bacterium]